MNGNREYRRIVLKDGGGAVTVVHIGIHNHGLFHRAIRLQFANPHGHVMYRAESFTMPGMRMMKSPAQIRTEAVA